MTYFMALLIALSALFTAPSQAPTEALIQAPTQAIQAPLTALSYESPKVTTSPAPEAPVQAPQVAPAEAPRCEEDMPCWDCTTMGNLICGTEAPQPTVAPEQPTVAPEAPVLTAQGINPECSEQSMQTAADGSCMASTVCAAEGNVLDDDGNCGPLKEND